MEKSSSSSSAVLDMCTGSGCIAIAIANYVGDCTVDAVDVSERALNVAKENAEHLQVSVHFIQSDLFENITKQYDLIVSNPPYISSDEIPHLQKEVQREPQLALDGGKDGLEFYRKIVKQALSFLKEEGYLMVEIGYNQGEAVSQLLKQNGYKKIKVIKDLSGNNRVVVGQRG